MKYHKIPGVEKTLCTAEQKIAYNYASAYYDTFYKEYKIQVTEHYKHDVLIDFRDFCMDAICKNEKITKKYDIDSIFCCLNAGLCSFMELEYHILTSYEEIGEMFPAHYL